MTGYACYEQMEINVAKPYVRGKQLNFREITEHDAEFVLSLRTDPAFNTHLSATENDVEKQRAFIRSYQQSTTDFYFIITNKSASPVGTIRIYDIQGDSFCWGSWILSADKPKGAGIESAMMLYDFAFFSLHYAQSHFDVRKANERVVAFHQRLGATITHEDELNYYFTYSREQYLAYRARHLDVLPS